MSKSTDRLRIQRKTFDELTISEKDGWSRLLRESTNSRWAFLSPTYADAVNRSIGVVDVLLCWRHDELQGVMPLQRAAGWMGGLGLCEPVGRVMSDYFGLVAVTGMQFEWSELLSMGRVPCLYFTHLDETQARHGLIGEMPKLGLRTRIHPDGGAAHWEWLRTKDKKLVNDTERRERKLEAEHGSIEFEMQTSTPEPDLELLIALKNVQYKRTGHDGGALLNQANARLLRRLLVSNDPDCMPRFSVLRCSGKLVAAHFGVQCGSVLHYWFPVYDSRFSSFSPGRILYRRIMSEAHFHGITCIDRGEGDSAAKRDFANEEHLFYKGLVATGWRGKALSRIQSLRWRLAI